MLYEMFAALAAGVTAYAFLSEPMHTVAALLGASVYVFIIRARAIIPTHQAGQPRPLGQDGAADRP